MMMVALGELQAALTYFIRSYISNPGNPTALDVTGRYHFVTQSFLNFCLHLLPLLYATCPTCCLNLCSSYSILLRSPHGHCRQMNLEVNPARLIDVPLQNSTAQLCCATSGTEAAGRRAVLQPGLLT